MLDGRMKYGEAKLLLHCGQEVERERKNMLASDYSF